ncbi:MAG: peptidase T [Clostridiaceae bacterium]
MSNVKDNLLRYVVVNTRSDENSSVTPSSENQLVLANMLKGELEELGLETSLDENGYLFGYLASNCDKKLKTVGFLAHLDTADFNSENVNPRIIEYKGGDIVLNEEKDVVMKVSDFPTLSSYIGQDLIVTDGTTLLGADDKAGIAEIMAALKILHENPEIKHGRIHVAFTPDEEIGRGPALFDVEKFGADYGYTMDGGPLGELQYENFNAASVKVTLHGRSVHPGSAKNKMKNAITMANQFDRLLPEGERPEYTEGYDGFYHLLGIGGTVDKADLTYIIRDFDANNFVARKNKMIEAANEIDNIYGNGTVTLDIKDSYRNMKEMVSPHMFIVENARKAMEMAGINPIISPVRGGTDGAQLSFKGLPCPNIFTGGENFHGEFEFISVQSMEKAVSVILNIIRIITEAENDELK